MPICLRHRRMAFGKRDHGCRPVRSVSVGKLWRQNMLFALKRTVMRNKRKRRQTEVAADVFGRFDRIVKVIQKEREADAARKRHKERYENIAASTRADRRV